MERYPLSAEDYVCPEWKRLVKVADHRNILDWFLHLEKFNFIRFLTGIVEY